MILTQLFPSCLCVSRVYLMVWGSLLLTLGAVVDGPDAPILVSELLQQSLAAELQVPLNATSHHHAICLTQTFRQTEMQTE